MLRQRGKEVPIRAAGKKLNPCVWHMTAIARGKPNLSFRIIFDCDSTLMIEKNPAKYGYVAQNLDLDDTIWTVQQKKQLTDQARPWCQSQCDVSDPHLSRLFFVFFPKVESGFLSRRIHFLDSRTTSLMETSSSSSRKKRSNPASDFFVARLEAVTFTRFTTC